MTAKTKYPDDLKDTEIENVDLESIGNIYAKAAQNRKNELTGLLTRMIAQKPKGGCQAKKIFNDKKKATSFRTNCRHYGFRHGYYIGGTVEPAPDGKFQVTIVNYGPRTKGVSLRKAIRKLETPKA